MFKLRDLGFRIVSGLRVYKDTEFYNELVRPLSVRIVVKGSKAKLTLWPKLLEQHEQSLTGSSRCN